MCDVCDVYAAKHAQLVALSRCEVEWRPHVGSGCPPPQFHINLELNVCIKIVSERERVEQQKATNATRPTQTNPTAYPQARI